MNSFDSKFGSNFLASIPTSPGIYRIHDESGHLIYIGKAKNLRRRLSQYRNAKRRRKHRKMRKIIENASQIEFEVCSTEYMAEALEMKLIQTFRPKWNVAGAFYFLYPMVGMKFAQHQISFCYTTQPEHFPDFSFHGAFRSREITGEAFFSLMKLLRFIGHPAKRTSKHLPKYSYLYEFRQLPNDWSDLWQEFWKGKSRELLETLILALVENAAARQQKSKIQDHLNNLSRFWKHEASLLFKARTHVNHPTYPVSQQERDVIFLKYRYYRMASVGGSQAKCSLGQFAIG